MPNWKILVDKGSGSEVVTLAELKAAMGPLTPKPPAKQKPPESEPDQSEAGAE